MWDQERPGEAESRRRDDHGLPNSPVPLGRTMSSEEVVAGNVKGEIKEGGEVEQSSWCGD
jgi:hypothetical protein